MLSEFKKLAYLGGRGREAEAEQRQADLSEFQDIESYLEEQTKQNKTQTSKKHSLKQQEELA